MPAEEACVVQILLFRDGVLVELLVVGVGELDVLETFVRRDEAVTDDLDLWLVGDGLQVWVKNTALCVERFPVAVAFRQGVEAASELILGFWRETGLVLKDEDVATIECVTNG